MGCLPSKKDSTTEGGIQSQLLQTDTKTDIWTKYKKGKLLGAGMTGSVNLATHKKTKRQYAVKSINLRKLDPAQLGELRNEIALLRKLDHPQIVRLFEVYERKSKIFLVMQYLSGKDLGQARLSLRKRESVLMPIIKSICRAISYCHANNIVHRDIKPENFVFAEKGNSASDVIVIDFGISKNWSPSDSKRGSAPAAKQNVSQSEAERNMKTYCGTPYYMSPEVINKNYDEKSDCWAVGVLTYHLLTGQPPFDGRSIKQLRRRIRRGHVSYPDYVTDNCKAFIKGLINVNPKARWSMAEALKSKWLSQTGASDALESKDEAMAVEEMLKFQKNGRLKKLALMVGAYMEDTKRANKLKKAFISMDKDNSGTISKTELKAAIDRQRLNINIDEVFSSLDVDQRGYIGYTEFLAATLGDDLLEDKQMLQDMFTSMDRTKSGTITKDDIQQLLGEDVKKFDPNEMIGEGDFTKNKKISFDEFCQLMGSEAALNILADADSNSSLPRISTSK